MGSNSTKQHWERIYQTKDTMCEVSWYQDVPKTSIDLILSTGIDENVNIIDIGGGDSRLVDKLLELGFKNISILDISAKALQKAKTRLREKAESVAWIEADILEFDTESRFDIWHDRAAFHFLTKKEDIVRYVGIAGKFIKPSGYLIISTFSISGPKKCSGLDITQYSEDSIKKTFQKDFSHMRSFEEIHTTPFNTKQNFLFNLFRRT
ncbi:methyltransferase domain-containing protein [Candidatus Peregrinibacteria bacterium]|nr:methyltransferase domain-containing protein [Candidatus Peregrinibacteria bacterium]